MDWLSQNWVWVLIGIAFIAMHLFGHGGHGGHEGHGGRAGGGGADRRAGDRAGEERPKGHRH